jgi:ribosomal protein L29
VVRKISRANGPPFSEAKKEKRLMTRHVVDAPGSEPVENLYELDYYTWALEQAQALRARRTEALDWENLAEEVEGLGRSEARELESRLEALLVYLLKWRYQPKRRSRSWRMTIREQRQRVARVLSQNPGLKPMLGESVVAAYAVARLVAIRETRLAERTFPPASSWSFEQIAEAEFWPKAPQPAAG